MQKPTAIVTPLLSQSVMPQRQYRWQYVRLMPMGPGHVMAKSGVWYETYAEALLKADQFVTTLNFDVAGIQYGPKLIIECRLKPKY